MSPVEPRVERDILEPPGYPHYSEEINQKKDGKRD
jgi:hypothetical protein